MTRADVAIEIAKLAENIVRAERTAAFASKGTYLSSHTLGALVDLRRVIVGEKAVLAELEKHRSSLNI